jgi:hypothetical protein
MSKEKKPRKRKDPVRPEPVEPDEPIERQTQEKGALVPPARRPPTAIGADTLPPGEPPRARPPMREPQRPALFHFVQGLRQAIGALLDLADGLAEAITRRTS